MKVDLSKQANAPDGSPLFEGNASMGVAIGSYLLSISTHNPREMRDLNKRLLKNKPLTLSDQEIALLIEVTTKSNYPNSLKNDILDILEVQEAEVVETDD